jgi:NAD-dependent dihydropyrimidine dehydrogenase PreA subunit
MSVTHRVAVNEAACTGCGACVELCPPDVLRLSAAAVAYVAYPNDCEACYLCQLGCGFRAIEVHVVLDSSTRSLLDSFQ